MMTKLLSTIRLRLRVLSIVRRTLRRVAKNSRPVEFELAVADVSVSACDKLAEALTKAGIRVLVEQAYIDNRQHTWGIGYSGSAGEGTRMRIWVHRDDLDKANPIIESTDYGNCSEGIIML